jgi:hypothetical protein
MAAKALREIEVLKKKVEDRNELEKKLHEEMVRPMINASRSTIFFSFLFILFHNGSLNRKN